MIIIILNVFNIGTPYSTVPGITSVKFSINLQGSFCVTFFKASYSYFPRLTLADIPRQQSAGS